MADSVTQTKYKILITHFMKALFYIANIPLAPYMYKLIKHLNSKMNLRILMALLLRASLYVFGTRQNLTKIYLK